MHGYAYTYRHIQMSNSLICWRCCYCTLVIIVDDHNNNNNNRVINQSRIHRDPSTTADRANACSVIVIVRALWCHRHQALMPKCFQLGISACINHPSIATDTDSLVPLRIMCWTKLICSRRHTLSVSDSYRHRPIFELTVIRKTIWTFNRY